MKKNLKYFLVGAGAVVAGYFAYTWLRDRPEEDIIAEPVADTTPPRASAEHHISQEYIEHRRELYRKRAAERAVSPTASKGSQESPTTSCENSAQEKQEAPVKKTEGPTDPTQDPKENISSDHNDEPPADCPEDNDSVPTGASSEETSPTETGNGDDMGEVPAESEGQKKSKGDGEE